ncbi:NADPH-dependent FMN reductase family protein [Chitinimonas naiadis]
MTSVILLAGSPNNLSRSTALLQRSATVLTAHGIDSQLISVADFPPQALLYGWKHATEVASFLYNIARADGVIVATPVYKAAYSGALKLLLDILPERAFAGKVILPLAVGANPNHVLAVDYALKPVLGALKAKQILDGAFAVDGQIEYRQDGSVQFEDELQARLTTGLARFIDALPAAPLPRHDPGLLAQRVAAAQLGV